MTLAELLLSLAVQLAPYEPRDRLRERADAIAQAVGDDTPRARAEGVALLVIDFNETTLGRAGVPFGACAAFCRVRCGLCRVPPLFVAAQTALRVWRASALQCGHRTRARFAFYHSGVCRRDRFADGEATMFYRLMPRAVPLVGARWFTRTQRERVYNSL